MLKPRLQFGCPHANGFSSTKMKSDINFNADKIEIIYFFTGMCSFMDEHACIGWKSLLTNTTNCWFFDRTFFRLLNVRSVL